MQQHPFDVEHGVVTTGYAPWWLLGKPGTTDAQNNGYAGCQPSCIRRALSVLPKPDRFAFLDIGCGKGRSSIVASEFPFRRIVGVEIAPELCATARTNAAEIRRRYPARAPIEIIEGDASQVAFPDGDLVVFFAHSFGAPTLQILVDRLVAAAGRSCATGG